MLDVSRLGLSLSSSSASPQARPGCCDQTRPGSLFSRLICLGLVITIFIMKYEHLQKKIPKAGLLHRQFHQCQCSRLAAPAELLSPGEIVTQSSFSCCKRLPYGTRTSKQTQKQPSFCSESGMFGEDQDLGSANCPREQVGLDPEDGKRLLCL